MKSEPVRETINAHKTIGYSSKNSNTEYTALFLVPARTRTTFRPGITGAEHTSCQGPPITAVLYSVQGANTRAIGTNN